MQESKKTTHKPGLGSVQDATARHAISKRGKTKQKREEKLGQKRKAGATSEAVALPSLINTLPPTLDSLESVVALNRILQHGIAAEPYFAWTDLDPKRKDGPWIFPDDSRINTLLSIVHGSQDIPLLRAATNCLVNISSHDESYTWALKLMPGLAGLFRLAEQCPDGIVRENVLWTLANMSFDNPHSRDTIVENGVLDVLRRCDLDIASYLFRALFKFHPFPPIAQIAPVWQKLAKRPDEDLKAAAMLMLRSPDDAYKLAILQDDLFWAHLTSSDDNARITVTLSNAFETHPLLMKRNAIALYASYLNSANPVVRAEGGLGLCNMASSGMCLPELCNHLGAIQSQLARSDVFRVRKQVYWIFCTMITTARGTDQHGAVFPLLVERGCINYLCSVLAIPGELALIARALKALYYLADWDQCAVRARIEECQGDEGIEALTTHEDAEIREWAEKLCEKGDEVEFTGGSYSF